MNKRAFSFRKGAGEYIGAAVVMPFILIIILFIINVFQIAQCEQKLIFAAYTCGREAVTQYDKNSAEEVANETLKAIYTNGEDVSFQILPEGLTDQMWVKGNVIIITVRENLSPILGVQRGTHERRIAMMIEHSMWAGKD